MLFLESDASSTSWPNARPGRVRRHRVNDVTRLRNLWVSPPTMLRSRCVFPGEFVGSLGGQAMLYSPNSQLGARVQVELGEDVGHVGVGCTWSDHQLFGNLAIRAPTSHQPRDLALARTQRVCRIV